MHRRGFTALELLTVIGIVAFLTLLSVPAYSTIKNNVTLGNAAQELLNTLRVAQNDSMSAKGGTGHGVHIEPDKYIRYFGDTYVPGAPTNIEMPLGNGLSATSVPATPVDVHFTKLTGGVSASVVIDIQSSGKHKTVTVGTTGSMKIE